MLFGASQPMFPDIDASHDSLNLTMWPVSDGLHDAVGSSAYHPWRSRTPDTTHTSAMPNELHASCQTSSPSSRSSQSSSAPGLVPKKLNMKMNSILLLSILTRLMPLPKQKWTVTHHQLASSLLSKNSTLVTSSDSRIGAIDPGQKAHP